MSCMAAGPDSVTSLPHYPMFINGKEHTALNGARFETRDPASGEVWATVCDGGEGDVALAVSAAKEAGEADWSKRTGFERARVLRRVAHLIEERAESLARLECRDSGRLYKDTLVQVGLVADWFNYFAGLADKFEGESIPTDSPDMFVYTRHEPVGVVAAIIPWNAPLLLLAWKLAPALAAGCTLVVKPSDYTPVTALALGELLIDAGVPAGAYNVVTGFGPDVGVALTAHTGVAKIAFTGSTRTGIAVGAAAMQNLTSVTLELGGKSANVIFDDADREAAINGALNAVFVGSGQTCMAGSRLLVHEDIYDDIVAELVKRTRKIRLGDPLSPETQMGPLVNELQHRQVLDRLAEAVENGAVVETGGHDISGLPGLFVAPTVITGVDPSWPIAREEVFGPVVVVMKFATEKEAITLANSTDYGLAAAVWTKDIHRGHRVAHALRAGTVWVNTYRMFSPAVPFGGFGLSGLGRENGYEAMRDFTETKAIWVELANRTKDPFGVR